MCLFIIGGLHYRYRSKDNKVVIVLVFIFSCSKYQLNKIRYKDKNLTSQILECIICIVGGDQAALSQMINFMLSHDEQLIYIQYICRVLHAMVWLTYAKSTHTLEHLKLQLTFTFPLTLNAAFP